MAEATALTSKTLMVEGLTVRRGGRPVLRDVSLALRSGSITALLGPNGAGKSSLVQTMAGVLQPEAGRVLLNGANLVGRRPEAIRAAGIATVLEGHQVLSDLSVEENFRAAGSQWPVAVLEQHVAEVFAIFHELKPKARQKAGTLSGGQQQMVALGHALMCRPAFMLVDELSLGLAPLVVQRLMGVIQEIARGGVGILLIEQFTHLALKVADAVYVIDRGAIRFQGTPAEVQANPQVLHEAYLAQ